MSWIKIISFEEAEGKLKRLYNRIKGPNNVLDNVLTIHSLRPHTLEAHMVMYKSVLHHSGNSFPKWYLETLGTYVSQLNHCNYCAKHHVIGLERELADDAKFALIQTGMTTGDFSKALNEKQLAGMQYAIKLTEDHKNITRVDMDALRSAGLDDGEILEVNQVVSYFNYVNRMVVGLGVDLENENIGLSPQSSDSDDWSHQ